jgi:DNA-binding PadR family transcriptional regulator
MRQDPPREPSLPLKPQWFQILLALSHVPSHGADIVRSVLEQTGGSMHLWPATLYGSLDDLAAAGWIEEVSGETRPEGVSEKMRIYRLTAPGASVLAAEAHRLQAMGALALARLDAGEALP